MDPTTTRERILDASRRLFNEKGYAGTKLAEIAASVGIAPGNLTYHFPTKRQIVAELQERMAEKVREQRQRHQGGAVSEDYAELLLFAMNHASENRFLLRDRAQLSDDSNGWPADLDMSEDLEALHGLLNRARKEGLFRRDLEIDLGVLARSLWIVSRYWMDSLSEIEGVEELGWEDLERGVQHHFAVLLPYLTAPARRDLDSALRRAWIRFATGNTSRKVHEPGLRFRRNRRNRGARE